MAARDLILNNFWWKLLSLILAALTWLTIQTVLRRDQAQSTQSPVVTVNSRTLTEIPITLLTSPNNTNQFRINPLTVTVVVTGNVDDLNQLQPQQITAFLDVTRGERAGEKFKDVQVQVPPQFKLIRTTPSLASLEPLPPNR